MQIVRWDVMPGTGSMGGETERHKRWSLLPLQYQSTGEIQIGLAGRSVLNRFGRLELIVETTLVLSRAWEYLRCIGERYSLQLYVSFECIWPQRHFYLYFKAPNVSVAVSSPSLVLTYQCGIKVGVVGAGDRALADGDGGRAERDEGREDDEQRFHVAFLDRLRWDGRVRRYFCIRVLSSRSRLPDGKI